MFGRLEDEIVEKHDLVQSFCSSFDALLERRGVLLEERLALKALGKVLPAELGGFEGRRRFRALIGLLPAENVLKLRKLLFRVARENVVFRHENLDEVKDSLLIKKKKRSQKALVFVLFPKTDEGVLVRKIEGVLGYFDFIESEWLSSVEKGESLIRLNNELDDNRKIVLKTQNEINGILEEFAKPRLIRRLSFLNVLKLVVQREANFARQLAFIEEKDGFYQLSIWVPESFIAKLHVELDQVRMSDPTFTKPKIIELGVENAPGGRKTPTFFPLNDFTKPFQRIVDTYGVPLYKEANPGLFTIVTFPFLFGLMFGDIGHGLILLLLGCFLVLREDKLTILNEVKYLVLLMGFFALYCGFIYNEFFSVPFLTQQSCYVKDIEGNFRRRGDCTYAFGLDWVWGQAANETSFINSFKMKFSIIIGVIQMLFGIILKGLNALFFRKKYDFWFEALPQFIFMLITFGYMSFCIIVKWLRDWSDKEPVSIIQLFINFASVDEELYGPPGRQLFLQNSFIFLCFLCVVLMLFPKPLLLYYNSKKRGMAVALPGDDEDEESRLDLMNETTGQETSHPKEEGLGELFVHQMIETVEFVLGSVSNTASYLRLWALSLAHGQLSKVFLDMIFGFTIKDSSSAFLSFVVIVLGFVFFFVVTTGVIMLMDAMECFLHALRLHWVEFQNKFYKGEGKKFRAFKHSFEEEEEE